MEQILQKQSIAVNEVVYNAAVEQPIECDALLADYCPDIVKVLKCALYTNIGAAQVLAERITVDGTVMVHIYYNDEGGGVCHAEYKVPFSRAIDMAAAPEAPIITVLPHVDYVSCRAISPRRLDVRGAISLRVKVTERRPQELVSGMQGAGLELHRELVHITELINQCEDSFQLQEDLEIGYGKDAIAAIVRTDYRVHVTDYKVVAGKIVAKGDFMLHLLYRPVGEAFRLDVMEYTLPISQIMDCEGLDENAVCDVEMVVQSIDLQPKADENGDYRMVSLNATINAVAAVHRHKEVPVASDCYSTMYESRCQSRPVRFLRLAQVLREVLMHKTTLDLPEGVEEVLDVWCELDNLSWNFQRGSLQIALRLTVNMFAKMGSGECLYFEQSSDLEQSIAIAVGPEQVYFDPSCDVLSSGYNLAGKDKIDIRCEVIVKGCVYYTVECQSITEVTVSEDAPKVREQNKLYIYYGNAGERVWDIAKRYNTSPQAVYKENALEQDVLTGKMMLLIPMV